MLLLGSCGPQAEEAQNAGQASVTVDLPTAEAQENSSVPQETVPAPTAEAPVELPAITNDATATEEPTNEAVPVANATEDKVTLPEQTPSPAEPDPPASARFPLPNSVVARTIDRIGYRCGRVVSVAAVAGAAPGVYKVTCSSGLSYQASPVNGRYRFRQWRG